MSSCLPGLKSLNSWELHLQNSHRIPSYTSPTTRPFGMHPRRPWLLTVDPASHQPCNLNFPHLPSMKNQRWLIINIHDWVAQGNIFIMIRVLCFIQVLMLISFIYQFFQQNSSEIRDISSVAKKSSGETGTKRPRSETPSPLPAFKVHKFKKSFDKREL